MRLSLAADGAGAAAAAAPAPMKTIKFTFNDLMADPVALEIFKVSRCFFVSVLLFPFLFFSFLSCFVLIDCVVC